MPAPGSMSFSLRGEGPWQGHSTQTLAERGDRRFQLLQDCYVSRDGSEIRTMPGFKCVVNPASGGVGTAGYKTYIYDAVRPVNGPDVGTYYKTFVTVPSEIQYVWSEAVHLHCAEFVSRSMVLVGESNWRRERLYLGNTDAMVLSWTSAAISNGTRVVTLTLNITVGFTKSDASPWGLFNTLAPDGTAIGGGNRDARSYVYIEGGSNEDLGWLNGRVFYVVDSNPAANQITIMGARSVPDLGTFSIPARISKVRPTIGGFTARATGVHTTTSIFTDASTLPAGGYRGGYNGKWLLCTSSAGANLGLARQCLGSTENVVTFSTPWLAVPATGDVFTIYPAPVEAGSVPPDPRQYIDDPDMVTSWSLLSLPNVNGEPITQVYPAYGAPRIPDFGDVEGNRGVAPLNGVVEGAERSDHYWMSRRRKLSIPHRLNPHVAGNRLILAAPGYGCAWQVPKIVQIGPDSGVSGLDRWANDIFDRPRCLGVPKALMAVDVDTTAGWHHFNGTLGHLPAGTYGFVVQYKDEGTGESGLPSEPLFLTVDGSKEVRLAVMHPGYLMSETAATTIQVFRTKIGVTDTYGLAQTVTKARSLVTGTADSLYYGLQVPAGTGFDGHTDVMTVIEINAAIDDTLLDMTRGPNVIEQMPMGCNDAITARGYTFFGGFLGNVAPNFSNHRAEAGCLYTTVGDPRYPDTDEVLFRAFEKYCPVGSSEYWMAAQKNVPPAYAGQHLSAINLFPFPTTTVTLDRMTNIRGRLNTFFGVTFDPAYYWQRWKVTSTGIVSLSQWNDPAVSLSVETNLVIDPGIFQVSEQTHPGVTPATGIGHVDAPRDETIEAIGTIGDGAVFCTRTNTYLLSFTQTPLSADASPIPPQTASTGHGCIAPNSMVEAAGAPLWFSDFGPVVMSGGVVDYIGADIGAHFTGETADYLRDSSGRMRHAWSCYDAERNLIYFGVYTNRNSTTITYRGTSYIWQFAPDEARGRFPCDTVLVLSIGSRAWSVWHPPLGIYWMFTGPDVNGKQLVYFVGSDHRVYALDDNFAHYNRDPWRSTIDLASTSSFIRVAGSFASDATSLGTADNHIAIGMNLMVLDGNSTTIKLLTTVNSFDPVTRIIGLNHIVSVIVGDVVVLGYRTMRIKTNNLKVAEGTDPASGRNLALRHALTSRVTHGDSAVTQDAYVRARCVTPKKHGGQDVTTSYATSNLTSSFDDANRYEHLGRSESRNLVRNLKLTRALPAGQELEFDLEFLCPAQVGLVDASVEVP